ncbi:MAG: hypothetical protein AB8B52_10455 [Winogradskyella sp.]|uniref:hypothetical protein n=1 Tax=Winogradskyella sp. TaxID=1883156 RepID=UPI00385C058B
MNINLAPTFTKPLGEVFVLWYEVSNTYSIIAPEFQLLLESYLKSESESEFFSTLSNEISASEASNIFETLQHYLLNCNTPNTEEIFPLIKPDHYQRNISKVYNFNGRTIKVYFDSAPVINLIHPALEHFTTNKIDEAVVATFDIYLKNDDLYLLKDDELIACVPKRKYHLIQGKFIMHLLCALHNKQESDWIGTFHGSTITDGNSSIMFVGKSGKGKSTLCTLLASQGFRLLADDVSPMLSKDQHIYYNPSAISIKEGAFNLLKPIIDDFNQLPLIRFNKAKGNLKYVPCARPEKYHYPCDVIILVNFTPQSETQLERVSVKTILETLIPDSWLSPNPFHAQQFLEWLSQLKLYKLTYSDTNSVTSEISKLFKEGNIKV